MDQSSLRNFFFDLSAVIYILLLQKAPIKVIIDFSAIFEPKTSRKLAFCSAFDAVRFNSHFILIHVRVHNVV